MSASQDKRRRDDSPVDGAEVRQKTGKKKAAQKKRGMHKETIAIILVAVLILAVVVMNSSFFYAMMPGLSIGGTNYTTSEFNYFYFSAYYNLNSQYGNSLIDTSIPLDKQDSWFGGTWAEYFEKEALETMKQITFICDEAAKNGFELSQDDKDAIAANLAEFDSYAQFGYASKNQLIQANYGKGSNFKMIEKLLTKTTTAQAYSQHISDSYEFSEEELEAHYAEKKDTYDVLTYRQFLISGAANEEEGIDAETAMADAKEKAEAMAKAITDEESFAEQAQENAAEGQEELYKDSEYTRYSTTGQSLNSAYSEWMLDAARKEGDVEALEAETGYYVVMYLDRQDNHYNTRSMRHILIKAEADENNEYTDEAKEAARERAEELLDEWKSGAKTEDSFAELATAETMDEGSMETGGLYEDIYKGQMVSEFDAFTFDESRKPGDTGVVYGESTGYAGYHVVYYVGEGELYSSLIAKTDLTNTQYSDWIEAGTENYQATKKFTYMFSK